MVSHLGSPRSLRPYSRAEGGLRVVVCGSFRRETEVLARDHAALRASGCLVLSPQDVDFVAERDGFVYAAHEVDEPADLVEQKHVAALQEADMVWLHAPDGYVGPSAALELGVAHAFGTPVFAQQAPRDVALRQFVRVARSVEDAVGLAVAIGAHTPSRPLAALQTYYRRMARERGYDRESAQDTMLLLTEEVGELARAVRKTVGLSRAAGYGPDDPAEELADVQLYVLHLANVLGVSLDGAVAEKERRNAARAAGREAAA